MADICALMPTLHLNVFTFCKQLQKFSVILRSQKLVKPGKHLAVFEPCNSWIPFFNRKLVYLSIKCRDCLLLLTTFQYFSPFQKMWLPALFLKDQVHISLSINHILIFSAFQKIKKGDCPLCSRTRCRYQYLSGWSIQQQRQKEEQPPSLMWTFWIGDYSKSFHDIPFFRTQVRSLPCLCLHIT